VGGQQIKPNIDIIKRVLERTPKLSSGPKCLFKVLYQAGNSGLKFDDIASAMDRTPSQLSGVLGALGRRINNTLGIEGRPGVTYILEIVREIDGNPDSWGWRMRYGFRQVLKKSDYPWTQDWK